MCSLTENVETVMPPLISLVLCRALLTQAGGMQKLATQLVTRVKQPRIQLGMYAEGEETILTTGDERVTMIDNEAGVVKGEVSGSRISY